MKDPFTYTARWDSVGLDCAFCKHEKNVDWPNLEKDYSCTLHAISLVKVLAENGFKEGEWFCSSFSDSGKAFPKSVQEFELVQDQLQTKVLYGAYGENGQLKEIPFVEL